jgi:hypothetical protein
MLKPTTHRGYTIEDAGRSGYYFWVNDETYDGPESTDCGTERGVAACKRAIDEWLDENPEEPEQTPPIERCSMCPTLTEKVDRDHNALCARHGGR